MRNRIEILEPNLLINSQNIAPFMDLMKSETDAITNNKVLETLNTEGCEDFVTYIDWLGLAKNPNFVVLSSRHHYFYDSEDLRGVNSVINLKELNLIRNLKGFLHNIFHVIPSKSYFIGCFVDNKKNNGFELRTSHSSVKNVMNSEAVENGILSRIPFLNMLYSLLDSKTNSYLSKASVTQLMTDHGFKVLDITELNGMTYFCSQRIPSSNA
jgi:hypothetical protein